MSARWLLSLAALVVPGTAAAQEPPEQTPQVLFGALVVNDPRTTPTMRDILVSGAAFIAPRPAFADLTGDGRSDAVVEARMAGAAGTIGVYVFSTDAAGEGRLRVIFRSQALYRATVRVAPGTLLITVPRWSNGDDVCCPAEREDRRYAWDARSHTLRRRPAV
jgi:hypothetical protein